MLTINAAGLAKALGAELATTVTVTATLASNLTNSSSAVTGNAVVMVTPGKYLTGLQVKPTSSSIANFSAEQHQAIAYYSDGSQGRCHLECDLERELKHGRDRASAFR